MALTPAERMKRYRERLKLNPEKLESIKKKHAEYVKSKSKTVKDLTEKEKEKQRKIWRNQKRKQKQKKKQLLVQEEKGTKKQKIANQSKLIKNYKTALKRNQKLTKLVNTYKKRLYRLKISTEKKIQTLEKDNLKLKARTELLELTLKTSYKQCQTVKEKQTLKNVVLKENIQSIIKKTFVSKLLGLKGMVRITNKNKTENKIRKEIENFYVRDDVSRMTAGKKQCRTFRKKKEQIRYLTDTVRNLYTMYRKEGGKYAFQLLTNINLFMYYPLPCKTEKRACASSTTICS
ncbi:DNA ligase 1-like [Melitaea cinxia]|uniref:DNA ligase 1-like n=1 Tax=Melitaea cinxia TaxID=113334 RepID=UPI001E2716A5|nr:DNA ligase 1-like [Melitaea cinxia]